MSLLGITSFVISAPSKTSTAAKISSVLKDKLERVSMLPMVPPFPKKLIKHQFLKPISFVPRRTPKVDRGSQSLERSWNTESSMSESFFPPFTAALIVVSAFLVVAMVGTGVYNMVLAANNAATSV